MLRRLTSLLVALAIAAPFATARAGVVNPDISVIGQPLMRWSDDATDPARKRVTLDPGETEIVFDAYLDPYARGVFVLALGDEGLELEEGFFTLKRGLPAGIIMYRRSGNSARSGELSPAFLHMISWSESFANRPSLERG